MINKKTLKRIVRTFNIHGCMGNTGAMTYAQRKAYLDEAQRLGYLSPECTVTIKGKEFASFDNA